MVGWQNEVLVARSPVGSGETDVDQRAMPHVVQEPLQLKSHFLFGACFCLVERANEKGQVEGLVGYARRNSQVPLPA